MSVAEHIEGKVSPKCLAQKCRKSGCKVRVSVRRGIDCLIDMDHKRAPATDGKCCDYIFLGDSEHDGHWVVPLELKRGKPSPDQVVPQLQAGAKVAESLLQGQDVRFRPVAAYGGSPRKYAREGFKKSANVVRFRGRGELVRLINCGTLLANVLGPKS